MAVAVPLRKPHPVTDGVRVVSRVLDAEEANGPLPGFFGTTTPDSRKLVDLSELDRLRLVLLAPLGCSERAGRRAAKPRAGDLDLDGQIDLLLAVVEGDQIEADFQQARLLLLGCHVLGLALVPTCTWYS